jgi:hypothetical protein
MPAYNFQPQFERAIRDGDKTCTIRSARKRPTVKGDRFVALVGARSKQCRKILESTIVGVVPAVIGEQSIKLAHKTLAEPDADRFAHGDGFPDYFHMKAFFRRQYGLPFNGEAIFWEPPVKI